jgi:NADPH:quinone reductase-like Zn-dependent oxidoreductase
MTFVEAAAIPQAGQLALQGLRDSGQMRAGQKLLVNGAGGGVGTFAIQLAKAHGIEEVTGVDSPDKLEMLLSLGFDRVIDYTRQDFTDARGRYDLILDVKTNRPTLRYVRALRPGGTYVTVGGSTGRLVQALMLRPFVSLLTRKTMRLVILRPNKDLAYLGELVDSGAVKPVIDKVYELNDFPAAMRYFAEGRQKGKVVISIPRQVTAKPQERQAPPRR